MAAKAGLALVFVIALSIATTRRPPVTVRVLWAALWPTLSAALAMAAAVKGLQAMRPVDSPVFGLLRDVAAGAIVYIAATAVLWLLRGRPDGLEREVYRRVERILAGRD